MATKSKPNWKVLDRLLPIFEKEGWSHGQITDDWDMSLATLEGHLTQEIGMPVPSKHDYPALFKEYDQRLASGEPPKEIRATFESRGVNWGTFQNRRTQAKKAHQSTPDPTEILSGEQYTQEHPDTHQDADHTEAHPGTLEHTRKAWRTSPKVSLMPLISALRSYIRVHRNTSVHQKYTRS